MSAKDTFPTLIFFWGIILSSQFQSMHWVGQKVCSGFSVRCYQNTRKEPFGQPNGLVGLTESTLWLYRWGSGPVLANWQKFDLPSPDHRDEFRNQNKSLVDQPQPVLQLCWEKAFPWARVAKPKGYKPGWLGAISATAEEEASNKANAEKVNWHGEGEPTGHSALTMSEARPHLLLVMSAEKLPFRLKSH